MGPEKREAERVPVLGGLGGEIKVFHSMLIREISHFGATIEMATPLQLDSVHEIRLTLGDRSVVINGRVVHARICDVDQDVVTYRAGIKFVELSAPAVATIGDFVDRLRRNNQKPGSQGA